MKSGQNDFVARSESDEMIKKGYGDNKEWRTKKREWFCSDNEEWRK